jgi:hypothetical protein
MKRKAKKKIQRKKNCRYEEEKGRQMDRQKEKRLKVNRNVFESDQTIT